MVSIFRRSQSCSNPAAEEKGVRLQLDACEIVPVVGEGDLLFDAISNLVDNAIKHGGDRARSALQSRNAPMGLFLR
jgi:signal transduction histidine kinase